MDLGKEFIDKILSLSVPNFTRYDGIDYTDKKLERITTPQNEEIKVSTLAGLMKFIESVDIEDLYFLRVANHGLVYLENQIHDKFGRVQRVAVCNAIEVNHFPYQKILDQVSFLINARCHFKKNMEDDLEYVLRLTSNLIASNVMEGSDDGLSQSVVIKKSQINKGPEDVRAIVRLTPYRTFHEVEQPTSEFLLRIHDNDDKFPSLSLHEADGGMWKIKAIENIKSWLTSHMPASMDDNVVIV